MFNAFPSFTEGMASRGIPHPTTAWVIDHPSHIHILDRFIRSSNEGDIVFAVERPEVQALIGGTLLHGRPIHWLPRPAGSISMIKRVFRAVRRQRMVKKIIVQHGGIERLVAINAPLEVRAARQAGVDERILVLDVETDHLVQRLAVRSATSIVVPTDWREDLSHHCMSSFDTTRLHGPWAHLYVIKKSEYPANDAILIRRLRGDGNHDRHEMVSINQLVESCSSYTIWDEDIPLVDPWQGPEQAQDVRGVISQSVTVAIEAVLVGRPVLLASRAQRGVIDGLIERGAPILRWVGSEDDSVLESWEKWLDKSPDWSDSHGANVLDDWVALLMHPLTRT